MVRSVQPRAEGSSPGLRAQDPSGKFQTPYLVPAAASVPPGPAGRPRSSPPSCIFPTCSRGPLAAYTPPTPASTVKDPCSDPGPSGKPRRVSLPRPISTSASLGRGTGHNPDSGGRTRMAPSTAAPVRSHGDRRTLAWTAGSKGREACPRLCMPLGAGRRKAQRGTKKRVRRPERKGHTGPYSPTAGPWGSAHPDAATVRDTARRHVPATAWNPS